MESIFISSKNESRIRLHEFSFYFCPAAAKLLQSCPILCDPRNGSPPGSAIPGILQARTLELVAISFSNAWKWKVKVKSLSHVQLSATPWTAAYQAPPSMGFSRQEYWSGVPALGRQKWIRLCPVEAHRLAWEASISQYTMKKCPQSWYSRHGETPENPQEEEKGYD